MRINKYLANCGVASRRKVEEFVLQGLVSVNGQTVTELSCDIDETKDEVRFKGKPVTLESEKVYYMINKPQGYLSTVKDDRGRPTVLKLLHGVKDRVYPVGRLDYNTTGLLLISNDGEFTYKMTHPKSHVSKTYEIKTKYPLRDNQIELFQTGVNLGDFITQPAIVGKSRQVEDKYITSITIFEGHNRQIRRMFEFIGLQIIELKRVAIGNLQLGDLPLGKYRKLTREELKMLK